MIYTEFRGQLQGSANDMQGAGTYGLEPRVGRLVPDDRARARDLPEARAGDGVVLDRALVQRRVRTADVELRARLGELHAEDRALDATLRLRLVDEGRVAERGDLLVRHPEDAVDGVAREGARERGHRGECLRGRLDPPDDDGVGEDRP